MNTVTSKQFWEEKQKFFEKHNFDYTVRTTDFENERYCKYYSFEDGAEFYELVSFVEEEVETVAHGLTIKIPVKFCKTEYWTTESSSKWCYEKY